ncbi:MAG TPA: universal stress protein, partial [Candidatus Dormibacteraeota bacterium]|nr:universal stress protein [Candidatus Dormibacteraeota bacterium]
MRRILVGVDGSEESQRAVEWVAQLAKELGGVEVIAASVYGLEPAAAGLDLDAAKQAAGGELMGAVRQLFARAQQAGDVRPDVTL